MSRQYHERIEVQCGEVLLGRLHDSAALHAGRAEEVPTAFMWQGRVHVVRAVIDQWTQRLPWWRMSDRDSTTVAGLEQHIWRVEASVGPVLGTGVYDLAQDDHWRLLRIVD